MYIIQLTDPHLEEDLEKVVNHRAPAKQLELALLDVEKRFPHNKIIILTGDLVSTVTPKTYTKLANFFHHLNTPVYVIPGNHDDPELIKHYFIGKNIHHDNVIDFNHWHIALLDSSTPGKELGSGKLDQSELQRVNNTLRHEKGKNIIFFIHHPPIVFGAQWFQAICLENRQDFLAMVKGISHVKLIAFGHAHTRYLKLANGCLYSGAPSCWLQVDHTSDNVPQYSNEPGGYNWFKLGEHGEIELGTNYFG